METNCVLERRPSDCQSNAESHAAFLLNHVEGEFEDEDGDWATGFINADPVPDGFHWLAACHDNSPLSSSRKRHHGDCSELEPSFTCGVCESDLPLQMLGPDLACSCLCCAPCLQNYVELQLLQDITAQQDSSGRDFTAFSSLKGTMDSFCCPSCAQASALSMRNIQLLAPEAWRNWEEEASKDLFKSSDYVHCPGCNVRIEKVVGNMPDGIAPSGVPEFDRTVPFTELDDVGKPLSRAALFHKYNNYFRCALCKAVFCGLCLKVPYHLGYTCEEYDNFKNATHCLYCEAPIPGNEWLSTQASSLSVKDLWKALDRECVDASWCVEKRELVSVQRLALSVCESKDCRRRLTTACTRKLECGHWCGGLRGERKCLPCLEDGCREMVLYHKEHALPAADDWCSICMVESLRSAPSIQLKCGHIVHFECAKKKLKEGFPGPAISFGYLNCPQCSKCMEHDSLVHDMQKPLELMKLVSERAVKRLRMEKMKAPMEPEKLEAYALRKYLYYICCKCHEPYFGGNRDCGGDEGLQNNEVRNLHNPQELICGGCSASVGEQRTCEKGHGNRYLEFKCRYCCSMATFFCFGHTHFCSNCHLTRPDGNPNFVPQVCKGPQFCPLQVAHAPNGKEYCLGCSMCRILSQ